MTKQFQKPHRPRDFERRGGSGRSSKNQLQQLGFEPKKSLGQNFCQDDEVGLAVLRALAVEDGAEVWEIGPGLGALTRVLLPLPCRLRLFEIDGRLKPHLETLTRDRANCAIHWGDAMDVDFAGLRPAGPLFVCGNLPYYCGTGLVRKLIEEVAPPAAKLVFVLQKEVVAKACAGIGDEDYGFLSVAIQLFAEALRGPDFSPAAFFPNPKVTSGLLELRPLTLSCAERGRREATLRLASIVFGQRRKMALPLLRKAFPTVQPTWDERFAALGIAPTVRGEVIPLPSLIELGAALVKES